MRTPAVSHVLNVNPFTNLIISFDGVVLASSGRSFAEVTDSYIRLYIPYTGHELARFTLGPGLKSNSVVFCELIRSKQFGEPWSVLVLGEEAEGRIAFQMRTKLWDCSGVSTVSVGASSAPASTAQPVQRGGCC